MFGAFELELLLGRGGMAEAFLAHRRQDPAEGRFVLKRIQPQLAENQESVRRMVLEAQVASRLNHPSLIRFYEFGRVGDCYYILMEHADGFGLHRILKHAFDVGPPPPTDVALHIVLGMLEGLSAMHSVQDEDGRARPILHRDITPNNVILTHDGRPVIIDFGIAKDVLGPQITLPGQVVGTSRYMAPEHRAGEFVEASADVFSASVILFELLTGQHPWPPLDAVKELLRVSFDSPEIGAELRPFVPKDIEPVLLQGMQCKATDRFQSAREMMDALSACPSAERALARGPSLLVQWLEALPIQSDLALAKPVVSRGTLPEMDAEVMWTGSGAISNEPEDPQPDEAPVSVLSVPPLPPRRDEALGEENATQELILMARGKPIWVWSAAALLGLALGGALALSTAF